MRRSGVPASAQRPFDLAVRLVLAERIHGPDRSRKPADEGNLQDQTDDACDRAADREEGDEGKKDGQDETQSVFSVVGLDMILPKDRPADHSFSSRSIRPPGCQRSAFRGG